MGYYGGLTISGTGSFTQLGSNATAIGDMNGDGIDDFAVSTSNIVDYGNSDFVTDNGIYVIFGSTDGSLPSDLSIADVDGSNGFRVTLDVGGFYGFNYGAGRVLTNVGDVNGDGVDDLGIGGRSYYAVDDVPTAFVVFGDASGFAEEVSIGPDMDASVGFTIQSDPGTTIVDLASAGDINGDGVDDLLINQGSNFSGYFGEYGGPIAVSSVSSAFATAAATNPQPTSPTAAYVVFGGTDVGADGALDTTTIDGTNGFGIEGGNSEIGGFYGEGYYAGVGGGVIALGDVNGDGFDDLGLNRVDAYAQYTPGSFDPDTQVYTPPEYTIDVFSEAFILFGDDNAEAHPVRTGDANGVEVFWDSLSRGGQYSGRYDLDLPNITVAGIGDINGDGFDDVAISISNRVLVGEFNPYASDDDDAFGLVGVVFGGPDGVDTDGDGPMDGLNADVSLGTRDADGNLIDQPDILVVNSVGSSDGNGNFGVDVVGAGDVNGDGIDDFLITHPTAPGGPTGEESYYGETFLVLGRDEDAGDGFPTILDLDNLSQPEVDETFYRFVNDERFSNFAQTVGAAGDINGDGIDDLLITHSGADVEDPDNPGQSSTFAGQTYVVFGGTDALEAVDNADGANDNTINVANLAVDVETGALPIVVSVNSSTFLTQQVEGNSGATIATFQVQRTGNLTEEVSFDFAITGTGFSQADGADFVGGDLPSGTINFASGSAVASVDIEINGDTDIESSEDFAFTISNAATTGTSDISLGTTTSIGRILNDDFPASIRINNAFAEEDGLLTFTVTRSGDLSSTISVDYDIGGSGFRSVTDSDVANVTVDGASQGSGINTSGTFTFQPGETQIQITVDPVDDVLIEGIEAFAVNLSNAVADGPVSIADGFGFGQIIDNDFAPEILVTGSRSFLEGSTPGGFTPVTFEIVRRGDTDGVTEVEYNLNPIPFQGSFFAADSNDVDSFLPSFGNVVRFEDGESVKEVTVNVIHDGIIEPREQFEIRIVDVETFNGVDYAVIQSSATATILNDDGRPPVIPTGVEADVFGDPHIVTLDGLGYDFQAVGEYVLVESTIADDPRDFQVQVRFEPLPGSDLVSVTTRMAVNLGDTIVEIDALGPDPILIDGVPVTAEQLLLGAFDVTGDEFADIFVSEDGETITIVLNDLNEQLVIKNVEGVLNICVFLSDGPGGHANNVIGLMGNANGDTSDDLMLRDGSATFTNPTFEELYVTYAESWEITADERNFTDAEDAGVFPEGFPAAKISIDDLPNAVLANAVAAVDEAGITDPILREAAILDFALTGDESFVSGAAGLAADPTVEIEVLDAPELPLSIGVTPAETSVTEGNNGVNTVFFTFYRLGDDSDAVTIDYAIGGDLDAVDLAAGTSLTGQVTIAAGADSTTLAVGVLGDVTNEMDEALVVSITGNDQGALIASASGTTIFETDDFAPVAFDDSFATLEDTVLVGNVLFANPEVEDVDENGDTLTVTSVDGMDIANGAITLSSGAIVTIGSDGSFEYEAPDSLPEGTILEDSFTYEITDGNGGFDTATAFVSVTGQNDSPVANNDTSEVAAGGSVNLDLTINDTDVDDGDVLEVISATTDQGLVEIQDDGTVTFTAFEGFAGTAEVGYTVRDTSGATSSATWRIEVIAGANQAPTAANASSVIDEDVLSSINVGPVVNDPDDDALSLASLSVSAGATVEQEGDLGFVIIGDANFNGTVTVTYSVTDGDLTSDFAEIDVEILPVNDAPVLGAVGPFSIAENSTSVGTITASDVDSSDLTFSITGGADQGLFDIDAATGALSFINAPDFEAMGSDAASNMFEVEVSVSDGELTDSETLIVSVEDVNEAPTAANASSVIDEDVLSSINVGPVVNDPDDDALSLASLSVSAGATVEQEGDLGFVIIGDANFNGTVTVTYSVTDGDLTSDFAEIDVEILPVNDAPVLGAFGPFTIAENTTAVGTITASDVDSSDLTFSITGGADQGLFNIDAATGALSFADAPDFEAMGSAAGSNMFEVEVSVSDGELTDDEFVFVSVTDVDEVVPLNPVFGTDDSDRDVVGTEGADIINSGAGRSDGLTGLGGGDVFDFSASTSNGTREVRRISDFNAEEGDAIDIGLASVATVREIRGSTYLYLDEDRDLIILTGVSDFDTDSLL